MERQPSICADSTNSRGKPSKYGSSVHNATGMVMTACVTISTKCVPVRRSSENIRNHGSRNSVPGARRANSVTVAGHVKRCQEMANAAGIAKHQAEQRRAAGDDEAVQGVLEEIGADEQLAVIVERRLEEERRRNAGDIDPGLERRQHHPGDGRDDDHDQHERLQAVQRAHERRERSCTSCIGVTTLRRVGAAQR